MQNVTSISALFSLVAVLAVVLSSVHAKDLSALSASHPAAVNNVARHADDGGTSLMKNISDLHNHVEKQSLRGAVSTSMQADGNTLRALRGQFRDHAERKQKWFNELGDWLLDSVDV